MFEYLSSICLIKLKTSDMLKVYSSLQITTFFKSILTELAKIIHVCKALLAGLEKKISLKECSGKILEIPKKTWFAFRSKKNSLIVNFIKEPHDKKETLKKERVKNYIINN